MTPNQLTAEIKKIIEDVSLKINKRLDDIEKEIKELDDKIKEKKERKSKEKKVD